MKSKFAKICLISLSVFTVSFGFKQSVFQSDWYTINPLNSVAFKTYYLDSKYPRVGYFLINSDGDYLEKRYTPFLSSDGSAQFFSKLFFNYWFNINHTEGIRLKTATAKLQLGSVSFEAGKQNVWLGHGYHGSLLLSNNAEPYPLVKFRTEKPFLIPYIGEFTYLMLNGWPKDFKLFAHRFTYLPVSWFEFGITQTVVYKANYKIWEFPKIISASQENLPGRFNNDQRASLDVAFYLTFLKNFPPFENGKIYFEYAGEDFWAPWQPEDRTWLGPLGFEFFDTGITTGFFISTGNTELRIEYSQNYSSKNIFHNVHQAKYNNSYQLYSKKWYRSRQFDRFITFANYGAFMGHHMGSEADDLYFELTQKWNDIKIKLFFDRERHGLASGFGSNYNVNKYPETVYQTGFDYAYSIKNILLNVFFVWNYYENIDLNPSLAEIIPIKDYKTNEYITGITVRYNFYNVW